MDDLYFIRAVGGPVKIGRSANVERRFATLRCSSPVPLELLGVLNGEGEDEGRWHLAFHDLRMHGEWFRWNRNIKRAIEMALKGDDWVGSIRATLRPAVRQGAFSAPMVARITRKRIVPFSERYPLNPKQGA